MGARPQGLEVAGVLCFRKAGWESNLACRAGVILIHNECKFESCIFGHQPYVSDLAFTTRVCRRRREWCRRQTCPHVTWFGRFSESQFEGAAKRFEASPAMFLTVRTFESCTRVSSA